MAYVTLTDVVVLDNPTAFTNPFQFEVTFECMQPLDDDLEWKITYVGSAEDETHDQVLEEILVGPIPVGTNKFVFQADSPNVAIIPEEDRIGVTVVLVTCSYRNQEFVRVGYYVNNHYADPLLIENPPPLVDIAKLQRNILADKPRVTRFPIDWGNGGESKGMYDPANENAAPAMADGMDTAATDGSFGFTDDYVLQAASALDDEDDLLICGGADDDLLPDNDESEDDEEDENEMEVDEIDLMDDL